LPEVLPALAAMLVAVPAAIANGLVMYAPLGAAGTAAGALAGLVGAVALGIVAPLAGGTPRLVSAPSPAAAAFMAVVAGDLLQGGVPPARLPVLFVAIALLAGVVQIALGLARGGRLVKFLPYPVVAGYLSGAGILILWIQAPRAVGAPPGTTPGVALTHPALWSGAAVVVAAVTLAVSLVMPRLTRRLPATLVGLAAGMAAYRALGALEPALLVLDGNPLLVGRLLGTGHGIGALGEGVRRLGWLEAGDLHLVAMPALALAVLVSIDTLKTCLLVDLTTRSRHDSDRELLGQGLGNIASALAGGAPGTGIVSGSMVNVHGGARGRLSGVLAGVYALAVLVALGRYLAWLPVPALAAIVCLMAARMLQREALLLFRERHTLLDFLVVVAVIATAMALNLAAAAAAGVLVSVLLFLREQVRAPLVRRLALGDALFSKRRRGPRAREVLARHGAETVVVELQGSLFFGTADRLFRVLEPHLRRARHVILDLAWLRSIDLTAATTLRQIAAQLGDRGAQLALCDVPAGAVGRLLGTYVEQLGLERPPYGVKIFPHLDEALEWAEERILSRDPAAAETETPLALAEMELLAGLPAAALRALEGEVRERAVRAGERVFGYGDAGGSELYLVRDGAVRIVLPLENGKAHALATVGRGEFFGEVAFADRNPRSADAVAATDTRLFALSRSGLAAACTAYPSLETELLARLTRELAARLRLADLEVRALKES
jgi:SulP family sulfate permease